MGEGLAMALEHATAREPYSVVSCQLTMQLLSAALAVLPVAEWRRIQETAKEHHRYVYGPDPAIFDIMYPSLASRIAKATSVGSDGDQKDSTEEKRSAEISPEENAA